MKIILYNDDFSEAARIRLEVAAETKGYALRSENSLKDFESPSVEVILHLQGRRWLTEEKVKEFPNLRLIQTISAGLDHIDFELLRPGVIVCGNVGAYSEPIAEHVFGMILVHAKHLFLQQMKLKAGSFDHRTDSMFLNGKKLGILGAGGIGGAVARLGKCLGMTTIGINTSGKPLEFFDRITTMDKIDELLSNSDIVVIALPLSAKTKGIINRPKLEMMKEECILVNVARGAIVDEKDLYDHLLAHPKFRASFDVWWKRPEKGELFAQNYPFFDLENFHGTPHVSGDVPESFDRASESMVENVIRFLDGAPLKGIARREDYI